MQIVAAALLAFAPAVLAGSASVVNNCGQTVYFASVPADGNAQMAQLPSGGYSEAYGKDDIGVSIKLAFSASGAPMQFEFTPSGSNINYDVSNINGNPFTAQGWSLQPSAGESSDYPTCVPVSCAAGAGTCTEAYNQPDDVRTKVCSASTDLVLTLCPGGGSSTPSQESSSAVLPSATDLVPTPTSVQYASTAYSTTLATAYTTVTGSYPTHTHNFAAREAHPHRLHARHLPRK